MKSANKNSTSVAITIAIALLGSTGGCGDGRGSTGCSDDNDCKGTRVCSQGACVDTNSGASSGGNGSSGTGSSGTGSGGNPNCGFTTNDFTCDACLSSYCCSQEQACVNDATCTSCVTSASQSSSCANNSLVVGLYDCAQVYCSNDCGGSSSSSSSSSGGSSSSSSSTSGGPSCHENGGDCGSNGDCCDSNCNGGLCCRPKWAPCTTNSDCCNSSCSDGACADPCEQACSAGPAFNCTAPQGGMTSVIYGGPLANGCSVKYETGGGFWPLTIYCDTHEVCSDASCVPGTFGPSSLSFNTSGLNLNKYFYPTGLNECVR